MVWGIEAGGWFCRIQKLHQDFWTLRKRDRPWSADNELFNDAANQFHWINCCLMYGHHHRGIVSMAKQMAPQDYLSSRPAAYQLGVIERELLLVLAGIQSELDPAVVQKFEQLVDDLLDDDGWIEGFAVRDLSILAASWCRCCLMINHVDSLKLQGDTLDKLVEFRWQLMRSRYGDGRLMFDEGGGINTNSFRRQLE
ncbi:MAG: hypothetical protein AAGA30_16465, partial [Planctomycetota bacterium]